MSTSIKPFVIRAFDPQAQSSFHVNQDHMEQLGTFTEISNPNKDNVIVTMLTKLSSMTAALFNTGAQVGTFHPPVNLLGTTSPAADCLELSMIDLKIVTSASSASDLRAYRTAIRKALKGWAEKSRVPGARGFRLNAIKTPKFGVDKYSAQREVVIKTHVILGSTLFYNQNRAAIGFGSNSALVLADLQNLQAELQSTLHHMYVRLEYDHSQIGSGTL